MIAVGMTYMIMGVPYFLVDALSLNVNEVWKKINLTLWKCGVMTLAFGIMNWVFPNPFWYIGLVVSVGWLSFTALEVANRLMSDPENL
ncbi:hypothetical protein IMZ31_19410 (plasmid) [Pontibacillus sp. ALD_SL1]|uniref:hypothetical protein n=1 Tax=Pontibacillus sp. ALD_SL1 TaxID=2777185 RepID=UPI001A96B69D|nr:hypothetical protein [Pontibacillus sp. ALD_SL1]QST02719.1 hypothetical protein IMZ31_19410 [Pontibacillus sp. ALD_SL1]